MGPTQPGELRRSIPSPSETATHSMLLKNLSFINDLDY